MNVYLRLAFSIFCRSVLALSLVIGFFKPNAAHIRRLAVNEDVCGRVLYGWRNSRLVKKYNLIQKKNKKKNNNIPSEFLAFFFDADDAWDIGHIFKRGCSIWSASRADLLIIFI